MTIPSAKTFFSYAAGFPSKTELYEKKCKSMTLESKKILSQIFVSERIKAEFINKTACPMALRPAALGLPSGIQEPLPEQSLIRLQAARANQNLQHNLFCRFFECIA